MPLNPITIKRLKRFKSIKRASYSFWILLGMFLLSLSADLWCNDKPLLLRFEGKTYFPAFKFVAEDSFLKNGVFTKVDYKRLSHHTLFTEKGNWMLWPFIPYGPNEILKPEDIHLEKEITLVFQPAPLVASIDIRSDYSIKKTRNLEAFTERGQKGVKVDTLFQVSEELSDALSRRFENKKSPEYTGRFSLVGNAVPCLVNLSAYEPRDTMPKSARLTIRSDYPEQESGPVFVF